MASLGETDRAVLALRYFENQTAAEIGRTLKLNEEATKKRASRALEKLRKFFTKRGVNSTTAIIAEADFRQFHSSRAGGAGQGRDSRGNRQRRGGFHSNLNPHPRSIENYGLDQSKDGDRRRHGRFFISRNVHHG